MKKILLVASFMALAGGGMAAAGEAEANIEVGGLFCPSCGYIAGEAMESVDSVEIVDYIPGQSSDTAIFVVKYDDTKTTPAQITEAVFGYGYEAKVVEDTNS